jgi:hypothetical protein
MEPGAGRTKGVKAMKNKKTTTVVRWLDSYAEEFECTEVRVGSHYIWMRLTNGENRQIPVVLPVVQVRHFSREPEDYCIVYARAGGDR